jgi:hypothetical protein
MFLQDLLLLSILQPIENKLSSWQQFLQKLPTSEAPVLDYRGKKVSDGAKAAATITYDVGSRDLQQCADALMRIRAEYLFEQKRYADIKFHFVSGDLYSFSSYQKGIRPTFKSGKVVMKKTADSSAVTHTSLRKYLDIVYTYASTISLAKELIPATTITVGTVIVSPGSPGHCFMIVDEKTEKGKKYFKLVEGYTPAQTIYVLKNTLNPSLGFWHELEAGKPIETASYYFGSYKMGRFE